MQLHLFHTICHLGFDGKNLNYECFTTQNSHTLHIYPSPGYASAHCLVTATANELFTNSTATLTQSVINKKQLFQFKQTLVRTVTDLNILQMFLC